MLLLLLLCVTSCKVRADVSLTNDMARIAKQGAPNSPILTELDAAKGETVSFQIVVAANAGDMHVSNVKVSDLVGSSGARIPAKSFSLFREHYVVVPASSDEKWRRPTDSNLPDSPGTYPDALIPFIDPSTGKPPTPSKYAPLPFDITVGQIQPIFVDLTIPRDAAAGDYQARCEITSNLGLSTATLKAHVWDFALPVRPSCRTLMDNRSEDSLAAAQLLLDNRMMPFRIRPSDLPILTKEYDIDLGYLHFWSNADGRHPKMDPAPSDASVRKAVGQFQGGTELIDYPADEITGHPELYPDLRDWARVMHRENVKVLVTMDPVKELIDDSSGKPAVDIWCILPLLYNPADDAVRLARQKGGEIWQYTALAQEGYSPKWLLNYPAIDFRIHGLLSQSMGFTGLLYWRMEKYDGDVWVAADAVAPYGLYPGDGQLIYPGSPCGAVGPVPSMRLKWIRDGLNDFDYVQILKDMGRGAEALRLVDGVAHDFHTWSKDPSRVEGVKRSIALLIEKK